MPARASMPIPEYRCRQAFKISGNAGRMRQRARCIRAPQKAARDGAGATSQGQKGRAFVQVHGDGNPACGGWRKIWELAGAGRTINKVLTGRRYICARQHIFGLGSPACCGSDFLLEATAAHVAVASLIKKHLPSRSRTSDSLIATISTVSCSTTELLRAEIPDKSAEEGWLAPAAALLE